jgi:hypothetical protein
MLTAILFPDAEKGGRGKKSKVLNSAVSAGFSSRRLNDARSVLHHSRDLARRNLTKGQQAMALAMMYPEPEKGGRGKNTEARKAAETAGFSSRRLAEARAVLRHSRDLAESVIAGSLSLDDALKQVEELKQQANSTEAKLKRLRKARQS